MVSKFSIISEGKQIKLNSRSKKILKIINSKWPTNPLEIAETLEDRGKVKTLSAKYIYHVKKLNDAGLVRMKRVGNTYVVWPMEIERLRFIQELTREV